jgi:6-phosphogluconolactonase
MMPEIVIAPSDDEFDGLAAEAFVSAAAAAVRSRGLFRVALAGGSTPRSLYSRLAGDESMRRRVPWERVQFFWGDERHVLPQDPQSNFRMARETLFDRLQPGPDQVFRIKGEYDDPVAAAAEYERDLLNAFEVPADSVPAFDLILLGLGADGHTASLFPETTALAERQRLAVANWVPKFQSARITLTVPVLNTAATVIFLVRGADKAQALAAVLDGPHDPVRLPAQLVNPEQGRVRWLVDSAAARLLSNAVRLKPDTTTETVRLKPDATSVQGISHA